MFTKDRTVHARLQRIIARRARRLRHRPFKPQAIVNIIQTDNIGELVYCYAERKILRIGKTDFCITCHGELCYFIPGHKPRQVQVSPAALSTHLAESLTNNLM
ncbi:MAG: hypothetical protein WAS27_02515 [Candidatus Saccharimonadales bacterium]